MPLYNKTSLLVYILSYKLYDCLAHTHALGIVDDEIYN